MNDTRLLVNRNGLRRSLGYFGLVLCLGLNVAVLGPTLPALAAQTGSTLGSMGRLFLVSALGATLGTLLAGPLYDRLPGHSVLGAAGIAAGGLMAGIALAPSLGWMLVTVALKGFMDGVINNGANTLLVWTHRDKVAPYMNALHFCFGLGAFVSPLVVAQVVDIPGAYRWVYLGLGALTGAAGLRVAVTRSSPRAAPRTEADASAPPRGAMPRGVIAAAALFLFFYVGAEIAFGGWIYTYAVELDLAPPVQAAYLTSGFWLAFTIGRMFSVPLATRVAPRRLIAAALAGCVLSIGAAWFFVDSLAALWVAAIGAGFCMAPVYPSGFTLAVAGLHLTARASGVILLGDSFGGMILPWLVGEVLDAAGPRALVVLVLGSLLCDLLAFAGLLRARSRVALLGRPDR